MKNVRKSAKVVYGIVFGIDLILLIASAFAGDGIGKGLAEGILVIIYTNAAVWLYWLPTWITWTWRKPQIAQTAMLNFFGFALGITWVIAMFIALKENRQQTPAA